MRAITIDPTVTQHLLADAPVAIGVSGGKDSSALALEVVTFLDQMGHAGPRLLIHSDLGRVEWKGSLPMCERLADRLGLELAVVRRQRGDMMDRWLSRWRDNCRRYANLECVKLILPWSTPSMRFCTSELKVAIITRELVARFPGQTIISASGIRREESAKRKRAPISKLQKKLVNKTHKTSGYDWHPLLAYTLDDVLDVHQRHVFPLHEAYTVYGSTRVSCAFCILASRPDLLASSTNPDNHEIYREMVDLEVASAFSFQDAGWLGDVAPHLLSAETLAGLQLAKQKAAQRELVESKIPPHLLYTEGWPTQVPTLAEAKLLGEVRSTVGAVMGLAVRYLSAGEIRDRYEQLMAENAARPKKKAKAA